MEEEENMLKSYFKQFKKPVAEDPSIMSPSTIIKRDKAANKELQYSNRCSLLSEFFTFFMTNTGTNNVPLQKKDTSSNFAKK